MRYQQKTNLKDLLINTLPSAQVQILLAACLFVLVKTSGDGPGWK